MLLYVRACKGKVPSPGGLISFAKLWRPARLGLAVLSKAVSECIGLLRQPEVLCLDLKVPRVQTFYSSKPHIHFQI